MKKNKVKYIVIGLTIISLISFISVYVYKEIHGYSWKHEEIKKEAVDYMKKKYNMNVKVIESFFNFKFGYYLATVYDINDKDKSLIYVEKQRFYDSPKTGGEERLEDNYSKVYWEKRLKYEISEKYSKFCNLNDVAKINVDICYFTTPLEEGVSSIKNEKGVYIPLKPKSNKSLSVYLKTKDFSGAFLKELLFLIKDLFNTQMQVDLYVTGKDEEIDTGNNTIKTKVINIEYDKFKYIHSIEDLKKVITEF